MNERDLFLGLLELSDAEARAAYLDRHCEGDAALRAQVESLLRSHDQAGTFLEHPVGVPPLPTSAAEGPGLWEQFPSTMLHGVEEVPLSFLAPAQRAGSLGRIGHFEVLEILGHGGFGIVFRALDEVLQRVVAVKVLAPRIAATSPARQRFLREARSSAQVRHENVVQVHAVEEKPLPYLIMEFIPGETLQHRLDRQGPLPGIEVAQVGRQIAEGLAAAHAMGLVHRDIKPANILLESGPQVRVKITDFGMARATDDASVTHSGVVGGTPLYMSPEQARGEPIDARSDLFSLGSVLYALCSGRPPFRAKTALAVMRRVTDDTPRPIPEIIPEVPDWLCGIIARLHAKRPEDRYQSASAVAQELTEHLERARPPAPDRPAVAPAKPRQRWRQIVAALLLLAGVGMAASEATGVSDVRGSAIRLLYPTGTLVIEVDDPAVGVTLDGEEVVITGAGVSELRLKPGLYRVQASRQGVPQREELVTVERNQRRVARISREVPARRNVHTGMEKTLSPEVEAWEQGVAKLPAREQVEAVTQRLRKLNPGYSSPVIPRLENDVVVGLEFTSVGVTDLTPLRALRHLQALECRGVLETSRLADLSPLRGLRLRKLVCNNTHIEDLSSLRGMPLQELAIQHTRVANLAPLEGLPLEHLNCSHTAVSDLAPLRGMRLISLYIDCTQVTDLMPLRGMPLRGLNVRNLHLREERDGPVLRSLTNLETINSEPPAQFLRDLARSKDGGGK
ncbi:MAG: protein kinase [Gemmataceae bacterium]